MNRSGRGPSIRFGSLALTAITGLTSCGQPAPRCPDPITIVTTTDAGAELADSAARPAQPDGGDEPFDLAGTSYSSPPCASACTNLKRLGCPEGAGRPGEDSCYVVCRRAEATRGKIDFKPACIGAATNRYQLRACGTYRCLLGVSD